MLNKNLVSASIGAVHVATKIHDDDRGNRSLDIGADVIDCSTKNFVALKNAENRKKIFCTDKKVVVTYDKLRTKGNEKNKDLLSPISDTDDRKEKLLKPFDIAKMLSEKFSFKVQHGNLLCYIEESGCYNVFYTGENDRLHNFSTLLYKTLSIKTVRKLNASTIKEVYRILVENPSFSEEFSDDDFDHLVNMKNGLFDITTGTLLAHSADVTIGLQLNANYVVKPKLSVHLEEYLLNLAGGEENLANLLGAIGVSLSNYFSLQKAVFLVGAPRNGKSTLMKFLESQVFPVAFTTALSSGDLGNSFAPSKLQKARLSISKDEKASIWTQAAISVFKSVVGQDSLLTQDKCEKHQHIVPKCHLIFVGNSFPIFPEETYADENSKMALKRRIWYVPTGPSVPVDKVDPNISDWLKREKDAVVSLALLYAHKFIVGKLRIPECPNDFFLDSDKGSASTPTVQAFVDKFLRKSGDGDDYLKISSLCNMYNDFAGLDQVTALKGNSFSRKLKKVVGDRFVSKVSAVNCSCLLGYTLKEGNDDIER